MSLGITHHCGKPIAFPDAKVFGDIFNEVKTEQGDVNPYLRPQPFYLHGSDGKLVRDQYTVPVGPYCSVHTRDNGYESIYVGVNREVQEYLKGHLLPIQYDSPSYQIVQWDDGRALVLVRYSQILGSRYLAIIDGKTVWRAGKQHCCVCHKNEDFGILNSMPGNEFYCRGACYDTLFLPCLECGQKNMTAKTNLERGCCGNEQLCDQCYNKKHGLVVVSLGIGPFSR